MAEHSPPLPLRPIRETQAHPRAPGVMGPITPFLQGGAIEAIGSQLPLPAHLFALVGASYKKHLQEVQRSFSALPADPVEGGAGTVLHAKQELPPVRLEGRGASSLCKAPRAAVS